MTKVAVILGANERAASLELQEVIDFEAELANVSQRLWYFFNNIK